MQDRILPKTYNFVNDFSHSITQSVEPSDRLFVGVIYGSCGLCVRQILVHELLNHHGWLLTKMRRQVLRATKLLNGLDAKLELLRERLLRNPLTHRQPPCPCRLRTVVDVGQALPDLSSGHRPVGQAVPD